MLKLEDKIIACASKVVRLDEDPFREQLLREFEAITRRFLVVLEDEATDGGAKDLSGENKEVLDLIRSNLLALSATNEDSLPRVAPYLLDLNSETTEEPITLEKIIEEKGVEFLYNLEDQYPVIRIRRNPLDISNATRLGLKAQWVVLSENDNKSNLLPHTDATHELLAANGLDDNYGRFLVLHQPKQSKRRKSLTGIVDPAVLVRVLVKQMEFLTKSQVHLSDAEIGLLETMYRGVRYEEKKMPLRPFEKIILDLYETSIREKKIDYLLLRLLAEMIDSCPAIANEFLDRLINNLLDLDPDYRARSGVYLQNWDKPEMEDSTLLVSHRYAHFRLKADEEGGVLWRNYL